MIGKGSAVRIVLFVVAALLVWRFTAPQDNTSEETELLRRLDEEKKTCLWRKGLESDGVLGDRETFSTFNCPLRDREETYPRDLCTVHVLYLNHTARTFMARTPADTTSR